MSTYEHYSPGVRAEFMNLTMSNKHIYIFLFFMIKVSQQFISVGNITRFPLLVADTGKRGAYILHKYQLPQEAATEERRAVSANYGASSSKCEERRNFPLKTSVEKEKLCRVSQLQ